MTRFDRGTVMSFNVNPLHGRIAEGGIQALRGPIKPRLPLWAAAGLMAVLLAMSPQSAQAGTTWDGGGINTNFTTSANWNDDSAPTFTGGGSTLTFGSGGSTATVDTAADLARIILDRDAAFTLADGSGSLTLQGEDVGGVLTGITASPATAGTTVAYTISESVALGATQSWNVANNGVGGTSLSVSGVISGSGVGLTKIGSGRLALSGANTFSGSLAVADGVLSINSWNNVSTNGPLGNSAANVVLGSATTAGTLRYTGAAVDPPATPRGIELAAGGGVIQLTGVGRDSGRVHISGSSISGRGPLTIDNPNGARFLIVGSSTFSGPLTVQAGELQLNLDPTTTLGGGSNGLGSAVTVNSGALLTLWRNNGSSTIRLGSLAGGGTVRVEGGGTQTLSVGGDDTSTTFSGVMQNTIALTKVGSGTLTLSAANSFTGVMSIDGGTVSVGSWNLSAANGVWGNQTNNPASPATTFIQMNGGRINYTGASASGDLRGVNLASGTNTIDVIGGATLSFGIFDYGWNRFQSNGGDLVKEGAGTLALGSAGVANNIFTGKATINSGTLEWFGGGSMPTPATLVSDFLTINNGAAFALSYNDFPTTVSANIGVRLSGNATIMSGTASNASHTIAGPIADGATSGSLLKTGPGRLTLSASNSFTGSTRSVSGTLIIGNTSALAASTLDMNAADSGSLTFFQNSTFGGLTGSRNLDMGTRTLSIGNNGQSTTYSGALSNGSLTKVGSGALSLTGTSIYSGATTISAGRLVVDGSILASSGVSVASGAELGGSGGVAAITGAGLVAPGNSPGILTAPSASFSGGLDFAFEFTQPGAPTWSSAASSGNDVLRLTDATTPLVGTATAGNVFDIYFATTDQTYIGGIFTDRGVDFDSALTAATFNYYVRDDGGTFSYGGFNYASLVADNVTRSTIQIASADFAGGTVTNGYAMQFVVVPEPGSLALAGLGLAIAAAARLRRRT